MVPQEEQSNFESEKLWRKVSAAIANDDQNAATEEKTILEEEQRAAARNRKATGAEYTPKYFELESEGQYSYKHADGELLFI